MVTTLLLVSALAQAPECLSHYGQTACGFNCVAHYGRVACAQTPAGACEAQYGQVVCADPPRYATGMPAMSCVAQYGAIACGYHCVAQYGHVACAETPMGACDASYGRVSCADPPGRGGWCVATGRGGVQCSQGTPGRRHFRWR